MRAKKVFICVGEPSGDTHAAHLVEEIEKQSEVPVEFKGLGGEKMAARGVDIIFPLADYPTMGIAAVIANIFFFIKIYHQTVTVFRRWRPDVVILVDNPGMNLRLAAAAHKLGIKTIYYISPQVWAWWSSRIKGMKRTLDKMLVILPFEEKIFREAGIDTDYVGHPTFDALSQRDFHKNIPPEITGGEGKVIGILPGSRPREIDLNLPIMLRAAQRVQKEVGDLRFLIAAANEKTARKARKVIRDFQLQPTLLIGGAHYLMAHSHFAFCCSGTASLEMAFFQTPMVISYRVFHYQQFLADILMTTEFFGLPNILSGREIVPEHALLNDDESPLVKDALPLIGDTERRRKCLVDLKAVHDALARKQGASKNAAKGVLEVLNIDHSNQK